TSHTDDITRIYVTYALLTRSHNTAKTRRLTVEIRPVSQNPAVHCSPRLVSLLTQAVKEQRVEPAQLPSGAGHDAVVMSALTDVGMLFVRCKGGVRQTPAEAVSTEDA